MCTRKTCISILANSADLHQPADPSSLVRTSALQTYYCESYQTWLTYISTSDCPTERACFLVGGLVLQRDNGRKRSENNLYETLREKTYLLTCIQRRLKSDCASVQSDLSLRCPHEETLRLWRSNLRPRKILIRLRECAG